MSDVLVVSFTDLSTDPRVDRQIRVLGREHEIVGAGLRPSNREGVGFVDISSPPSSVLRRAAGLARLVARRYDDVYWKHPANVAALRQLQGVRADVVVANDLSALPVSLRLGPPVVFDAHEYSVAEFADKLWWRTLIAPYAAWQCRAYIPRAAAMTTVGQSIADAYERDTGVQAAVVWNAPPRADLVPTGVHAPVRILHHGAAHRGRGLEELVDLGDRLDDRFTLDLVLTEGSPGYRAELIHRAEGRPRVRFPDPWPFRDVVANANDYDLGVYALPPANFNQRFALPNKFFEFVQARLALVVGPSDEMARLVRAHHCGIVADGFGSADLAHAINALDDAAIARFKRASHAAANELCAEASEENILTAVRSALGRNAPSP